MGSSTGGAPGGSFCPVSLNDNEAITHLVKMEGKTTPSH